MASEFKNEPIKLFNDPSDAGKQKDAIAKVRASFGTEYPIIVGGEEIKAASTFGSVNPAKPTEVVGKFQKGDAQIAEKAMSAAATAFESWKKVPAKERAEVLFRAAQMMRERRFEFNALMILEIGKSWIEADADTAEAIDFMEYYAREALRYDEGMAVTPVAGEKNRCFYIPLGVGVVIPPWNFPNAILCGMTAASIVAGNTVILKPASDTPTIGYHVARLLMDAGLPAGVLNFITGPGSIAGEALVNHPKTRFITFTGSMEVGLGITEKASRRAGGQKWIKRVVAEMGGKDSIIVLDDADFEGAVSAVVASAFGFQGQKCSACSRVIVHEAIYDRFVDSVAEKTNALVVGNTEDQKSYMGPVSSASAEKKILEYIEIGKNEGRVVAGGGSHPLRESTGGYFVKPTVIADVDPKARISLEEIFGPVLAVIRAKDYDDALEIANNTDYGLTGAIWTSSRENWNRAVDEFHVGNLYWNRKCTGALVGGHPFGGFNMSGTDSKAGGRDYLGLLMQAKLVSETVR
ncbi:MAG: L-glutamate gamma-semialdehyde dehydrogenase [Planctomycetes bacterium]|nr:L-glutamate gamma-semialdehyde dehydrogenase [Planctomycetota bacterium]